MIRWYQESAKLNKSTPSTANNSSRTSTRPFDYSSIYIFNFQTYATKSNRETATAAMDTL